MHGFWYSLPGLFDDVQWFKVTREVRIYLWGTRLAQLVVTRRWCFQSVSGAQAAWGGDWDLSLWPRSVVGVLGDDCFELQPQLIFMPTRMQDCVNKCLEVARTEWRKPLIDTRMLHRQIKRSPGVPLGLGTQNWNFQKQSTSEAFASGGLGRHENQEWAGEKLETLGFCQWHPSGERTSVVLQDLGMYGPRPDRRP